MTGKPYRVKWRIRGDDGKIQVLQFDNAEQFFSRFFSDYAGKNTEVIFDDFRATGCWNWLMDWPEAEYFTELSQRHYAQKNLNIPSCSDFDNTPAKLLEFLIVYDSETERASQKWLERKQKNIG